MESKLYYLQEAEDWNSALPLGNGRLGCMFYGGVSKETLQLNEESIWAGPPVPGNRTGAYKYIDKARKLLKKGHYLEAQNLIQTGVMGKRISPRSYQPLGNLFISLKNMEGYSNYKRVLDLPTAIGSTVWSVGDVHYRRETFIPSKEQCIISKTTSSLSGNLFAEIAFEREGDVLIESKYGNKIYVSGQAEHNGTHRGVKFSSIISIEIDNGTIHVNGNKIEVIGADSFTVIISCKTDYNFSKPYSPNSNYLITDVLILDKYIDIKNRHIKEYSGLYNRMYLKLGGNIEGDSDPTDRRLANYKTDRSPSFLSLYFNYARYLTISSSRENTLCANLQGIWCKDMEAPWNSDYHLNVNIQMIYWLCEAVGLSELHKPFFDYAEALVPNGKITAKDVYNCRGTVNHHSSDVWMFTAPFGEVEYGMWPLGAGWNSRHFMEHFDYTGDKKFLLNRALPYLRETSLFFLDYLTEDENGLLLFGPASSPENMFYDPETAEICNITLGSSMAQQIVWETFYNYIKSLEILNVNDIYEEDIKSAFKRLKETGIATDGRVMEWDKEVLEVDPGHRHISHIYGIYPGFQYSNSPKYIKAAKKTLSLRLRSGGGHTGWSRAWIINLWARLKNSTEALDNINTLIDKSTLANLFDNHPPFQLDGNIGGASGILEMLVQSHNGSIELLPSLPKLLEYGEIRGLRVRGGFILDFNWKKHKVVNIIIKSISGNYLKVVLPDNMVIMDQKTVKDQIIEVNVYCIGY